MAQEILSQAPNIIPVLTDPANLWVNVGLAVATFFAVIIALFQDPIKKLFNRAKLKMEINLCPPDCHQIGLGAGNIRSFYIRIRVNNIGRNAAENVEVMPINFYKIDNEDKEVIVRNFLPINFTWSHFQPTTNSIKIPVGMFRHCDFGCMVKNSGNNEVRLRLDTMVHPNQLADGKYGNILDPGKYKFELLITGDNVRPYKKKWEIEFKEWSDSEEEIIEDKIKLREI